MKVPLGWWERLSGPAENTHLPLSSANGVSILKSCYRAEVDAHMCMCLLLLPSSDLTLGKMPLHLTPFVWSDLQRTLLGIQEYPKARSRGSIP